MAWAYNCEVMHTLAIPPQLISQICVPLSHENSIVNYVHFCKSLHLPNYLVFIGELHDSVVIENRGPYWFDEIKGYTS